MLSSGYLASGSWDYSVKVWDVVSGECVQTLRNHSNSVVALSEIQSDLVASGSYDETIK